MKVRINFIIVFYSCTLIFITFQFTSLIAQSVNSPDKVLKPDSIKFQNEKGPVINNPNNQLNSPDNISPDNSAYLNDSLDKNDSVKKVNELESDPSQTVFYSGLKRYMSFHEIASYCAPAFWYSPDEPLLPRNYNQWDVISLPEPYPCPVFEKKAVVYYELKDIEIIDEFYGSSNDSDLNKRHDTIVDLSKTYSLNIFYTHYYSNEKGSGSHEHDNEQVQIAVNVIKYKTGKKKIRYELTFSYVLAKAHDLFWYDNRFEINGNVNAIKLPLHILVEEGKHASCPDINADGYYSPGYDVNVRTSDAWGVRDVIRTDKLFTAYYQGWMTKVRKPEYIVYPMLPEDSPYRKSTIWSNNFYELRKLPLLGEIFDCNKSLYKDLKSYSHENKEDYKNIGSIPLREVSEEVSNSTSVAFRYSESPSVTITFPLLIIKNVEAFLLEGRFMGKLSGYFNNHIEYSILYTPSSSRFLDPYFSFGAEFIESEKTEYVFETGMVIRINTRLGFLKDINKSLLGIRLGVKNILKNLNKIESLNPVFEIGFGPF